MHEKCSKIRPLLVTLTLVAPIMFFVSISSGYDSSLSQVSTGSSSVLPDDSGKNVQDRGNGSITPFSQPNRRSDVEITKQIRRALMADGSLSTTARNVKVVTIDGTVILRGPVNSEYEKSVIAHKALQITGIGHVDNQLEVAGH